jgi:hypothetical protein
MKPTIYIPSGLAKLLILPACASFCSPWIPTRSIR